MSTLVGTRYLVSMYRGESGTWQYGSQPVYRAYNPNSGRHFFTVNSYEYHNLTRAGWMGEGVAFRLTGRGTVPVYRLYNPNSGEHHLTPSAAERDSLAKAGWRSEGVAFSADASGNFPVYRAYNPNSGEHFFTASRGEYDSLVKAGWRGEGTAWYGYGVMCLAASGSSTVTQQLGFGEAQAWQLWRGPDGSYRLTNRGTGRSLDAGVGTPAPGTPVGVSADSASRSQSWTVRDAGTTTALGGVSAQVARLVPTSATGLALGLSSVTIGGSGALAQLSSDSTQQEWALVDATGLGVGGRYEVLLKQDPRFALDVAGAGTANGANVQIYARNSTNAQKWWMTDEGDGWSVQSVGSGLYMDVSGARFADGQNVHTWRDNDQRQQRWLVESHGTTTVGGRPCAVVTLGAGNASDYRLAASSTGLSANVFITNQALDERQMWVLYPTDGSDPSLPVPGNLALADSVGGLDEGTRPYADRHYPTWTCPDAWLSGDNHYQWRWRRRTYASSWGDWTDWSAWAEASVTTDGERSWLTDGVDTSYDRSYAQAMEAEVQVRVAGESDWGLCVGGAADASVVCATMPRVTLGPLGIGPDGVIMGYASDLARGNRLYVSSVRYAGRELVSSEMAFGPLDDATSVRLPMDGAEYAVPDGGTVTVTYQVGTYVVPRFASQVATIEARWDAGSVDVTPEIAANPDRTLTVSMPHLGEETLFVDFGDGIDGRIDWDPTVSGGRATWDHAFDYPFNTAFTVYVLGRSADGDRWGVYGTTFERGDRRLAAYPPCHKFTWRDSDGQPRTLVIDRFRGAMKGSETWEADSESQAVAGRRDRVVTFSGGEKRSRKVEGVLLEGREDSSMADLEALARQRYATYYSPWGGVESVAVTDYDCSTVRGQTDVSISMTRVGDAPWK